MDLITQLIKAEIKKQHKSVRRFSEVSGIPYSTLSNALSKGVGGTSYETVNKICNILNLKQVYDVDLSLLNRHRYEVYTILTALDERAVHMLKTILSEQHVDFTKLLEHNEVSVAGQTPEDGCKEVLA